MPPMPQTTGLSDPEERVLLAVWKLRAIGKSKVEASQLQAEMPDRPAQSLSGAIDSLREQGFLENSTIENQRLLSLTPLGLAILRKLEEDRLQELK